MPNDPDIQIKIGTKADTSGIKEAESGLKNFTETAGKLTGGPGGGGGGVLGGLVGGFNKVTAAVGGVAAAVAAGKRAFSEYAEAQKGVFALDAALRQNGTLTDEYRESLQGLAGELQAVTAIADDQWVATMTRLTQFGVGPDKMREVLQVVQNAAGLFGGDLRSATEAVTRALQGNFEMWGRLGVQVPASASQLEKWNTVAQAAAKAGGGQLEAQAAGAAGQMRQLKNAIGDTFEAFGKLIVTSGILDGPLKSIRGALDLVTDAIGATIGKAEGLDNIFQRNKLTLEQSSKASAEFAKNLEAISKASESAARGLTAEEEAAEFLKKQADAQAAAERDRQLSIVDAQAIPEEQKAALRVRINSRFERGQFLRDQQFAEDRITLRERGLQNLDAGEAAAKQAVNRAEAALRDQGNISAEFDRLTKPVQLQIEALRQERLRAIDASGGAAWARPVRDVDAKIAAATAQLESITGQFNSANPPVNPALVANAEAARRNFESIQTQNAGAREGILGSLGRARFERDALLTGRQATIAGQMAGQPGVFDAVRRGEFGGVAQAFAGSSDAIRDLSGGMSRSAQVQIQLLREIVARQQAFDNEVETLRKQVARTRNF